MKTVTLGSTGITVLQNGFGALPIQRISTEDAVALVQKAYKGGMRFFDTARAYSDSEVKVGIAFNGMRDKVFLASKTAAKTPEDFWSDLNTSLTNLQTDYLDIYQFHCVNEVWKPGDGTGMYECMQEAKAQGKIRHIGITMHKIGVAEEAISSGLYETIQYPLSYLANQREIDLVEKSANANMGFIAMKGLAGGLLTNSKACMAFMTQFDNVVPIWGIQKNEELDQWLSFFDSCPTYDEEIRSFIKAEQEELQQEFCRGCGYCLPCPHKIMINQCARMSLMIRRAPTEAWTNDYWQEQMNLTTQCEECGICQSRCPYELPIPELLKKNYEDYQNVLREMKKK